MAQDGPGKGDSQVLQGAFAIVAEDLHRMTFRRLESKAWRAGQQLDVLLCTKEMA